MRLISSLLVATLAATTLTTSIAAACGGYVRVDPAPRVLTVSTHGVNANGKWTQRSFVVLEQKLELADDAKWRMLAPRTYDATRILMLARLAKPMEVTLVGPSGARVVQTDKQVALTQSWHIGLDETRPALEVPVGDSDRFEIAIAGRALDAKWRELDYVHAQAAAAKWLTARGINDADYPTLAKLKNTELEIVSFSKDGVSQLMVRQGNVFVTGMAGAAVGAVTTKGRTFLVVKRDAQLATLELPAATARS
ncbi:MAG TPA: hypothetical protein VIV11_04885 [Kofleriaceae bacterium]